MASGDEQDVRATLQWYIDGTYQGDEELVRRAFHPNARMSGYLQGQLLCGGPEPFFETVRTAPAPARSGEPYQAEITHLEIAGPAASATLVEPSYLGLHFTDYLHLLKVDGRWQIVSKTFMHR
jgi:4-oxalocrotonate tautomerase